LISTRNPPLLLTEVASEEGTSTRDARAATFRICDGPADVTLIDAKPRKRATELKESLTLHTDPRAGLGIPTGLSLSLLQARYVVCRRRTGILNIR
jgi:hypothetical protein